MRGVHRKGECHAVAHAGGRLADRRVHAALDRIASVIGVGVAVVADDHVATGAGAVHASFACGAGVAVVAGCGVVGVDTGAATGIARIRRARVVVVAAWRALRRRVGGVDAVAGGGVAGIGGVRVAVVAIDDEATHARAALAGVALGATVVVVATDGVVDVDALARGCVAVVVGAHVAVVADDRIAGAVAARAGVVGRARVAVVAGRGVGQDDAALDQVADVGGAEVLVVAILVGLAAARIRNFHRRRIGARATAVDVGATRIDRGIGAADATGIDVRGATRIGRTGIRIGIRLDHLRHFATVGRQLDDVRLTRCTGCSHHQQQAGLQVLEHDITPGDWIPHTMQALCGLRSTTERYTCLRCDLFCSRNRLARTARSH